MKDIKSIAMKKIMIMLFFVGALASCKKDPDGTPQYSAGDLQVQRIEPDSASGGSVLTLKGSGLGQISSVMFEKDSVPALFNPVFNTDNSLVFRVPDTASGGVQDIIFTNSNGKSAKVSFRVIALPSITAVSTNEVVAGAEVTLTGINLEDVNKVVLEGTTTEVEVVSKAKKELVLKMPATTLVRPKLEITNASGLRITDQEFVYIQNTYQLFTEGMHENINNSSWSANVVNTTDAAGIRMGSIGLKAEYTGSWGGLQWIMKTPVPLSTYKFVSFWMKGADVEKNISFNFNWANSQTLTLPPNVWTYFKFDLDIFKGAGVANLETFVMQINGDPATFYIDNILLLK